MQMLISLMNRYSIWIEQTAVSMFLPSCEIPIPILAPFHLDIRIRNEDIHSEVAFTGAGCRMLLLKELITKTHIKKTVMSVKLYLF